jgi:hypothetical protein
MALSLTSCTGRETLPQSGVIGNLTPEQMEMARRNAAGFESVLETVRNADVPYATEPKFYRSL